MIRAFFSIAGVTFQDIIRQPAYAWVVLATGVGYALSPALAMFSLRDDANLLKDFGVSTLLFSGLLLAAFGVSPRGESRPGIEITLFSKPVGRAGFLIARLAGVIGALALASIVFSLCLLLAARHGPPPRAGYPPDQPVLAFGLGGALAAIIYAAFRAPRSEVPFGAAAVKALAAALPAGLLLAAFFDRSWGLQAPFAGFDGLLAAACALATLGVFLLGAVALLFSVLLRKGAPLATLILFAAGALVPADSAWMAILPDVQAFSAGEVFYNPSPRLSLECLGAAALHAAAYSAACMAAGVWVLERRETI